MQHPQPTPEAKPEANQNRSDAYLSQRILAREARKVIESLDLDICGSRLKRIVRRYVTEDRAGIDFRTWFITYADPTGETAVRNVLRGDSR